MAFPGNGTRYVITGTLPGGEVWSTGIYAPAFDESVTMQSVADAQVQTGSLFLALVAAIKAQLHSGCATTGITVYRYTAGRAAVDVGTAAVPAGVGTASPVHPNQSALCVTLRTTLANRRGRGRMFFPWTGGIIQSTGLIQSSQVLNLLTPLGAWVDQINGEVWSTAGTLKGRVNAVDADLVIDTQNGRRDRLTSARTRVAIANPN